MPPCIFSLQIIKFPAHEESAVSGLIEDHTETTGKEILKTLISTNSIALILLTYADDDKWLHCLQVGYIW